MGARRSSADHIIDDCNTQSEALQQESECKTYIRHVKMIGTMRYDSEDNDGGKRFPGYMGDDYQTYNPREEMDHDTT